AAPSSSGGSVTGPASPAGQASHDQQPPSAFRRFMATGWVSTAEPTPARDDVAQYAAQDVAQYAAKRRALLSSRFPAETLVVPSGGLKVRANDTDYPFRPGSDFFWLTGCHEPDAVVILRPSPGGDHDAVLYVADRSDRSTPAFYTDRRYGELWVGPRAGVRETSAALEITCRPLDELAEALARLSPATTRVVRGQDEQVDRAVLRYTPAGREASTPAGTDRDTELAQVLSELRLVKDEHETALLEQAIAATVLGFSECVRELDHAMTLPNGERWLEGTFWRRARVDGNDVGYGSIVACGHHATILHWVRDDGPVRPGDLALLDMGVESRSLYTADITRTLPVNGHFSDVQRQVYDVVLAAQQAGIEAVRPGAQFLDPHRAAMRVIAEALHGWGLLPVSVEESLAEDPEAPNAGLHRRYTLHSTSHMLGLDVHDCAHARDEAYRDGPLTAGMVLTVEPGLYFQPNDITVPPELRGIGVRIEDDILVTTAGHRNLSAALPRARGELENWMARHRGT
ncbi:aminopeptidase P family protein, partial [Frankia sp. CiP1_Cm_nod1]|uniref:aminopeptidase P family protein n=2 Tax=unclassified Frankia TaxID=2632575 RepID=UPI004044C7EB